MVVALPLLALNRPAEAEAALRHALALLPGNRELLQTLARALEAQGRPVEAAECRRAYAAEK